MQEILDQADELAACFEQLEPDAGDVKDATPLRDLHTAVLASSEADRAVATAVVDACAAGHSWAAIGTYLGTSGEAARQKYGSLTAQR